MSQPTNIAAPDSFGAWLRRRRKALALTQAQVAERAGCTAATIRKLEADERKPSWQLAELLATALAVPDEQRMTFLHAARQVQALSQLTQAPSPQAPSPLSSPVMSPLVSPLSQSHSHHLPAPMTSLVNRVQDTANVVKLLTRADVRLLTLLGPPGIGKTRLALHSAAVVTDHFRDGVWFVDLAPLTDATQVLPAIAYTMTVTEAGARPLIKLLCATLADQQLLLLLDNCEQVTAAATEIATLLRYCKGLTVLTTSRTPLRLSAEYEYQVPSLSLPPLSLPTELVTDLGPESLMNYEAVQLFVARVQQHQHEFVVTPANAAPIVALCRRLEGIPLALELAAAALRRMSVEQLADLLQTETTWLHQLYSPARDLPPRQRTLYQAIAWSYSLLDANLQRVFRQLAVFVGGFTTQAALAICTADRSALVQLTEHNLLAARAERWQMLQMVREFALSELSRTEQGYERSQVQQRHTAYFVDQATVQPTAQSAIEVPDSLQSAPIAADYDNFYAALARAMMAQDGHAALTLCGKLGAFWETEGYLHEGTRLTQAVLAMPTARDTELRLATLERISILAWQAHQFDTALTFAEQAQVLAQEMGQPKVLVRTLNLIGRIFLEQGDYDRADAVLQECLQLSEPIAEHFNPGCPLALLGEVALVRGEQKHAAAYLQQALTALAKAEQTLYVGLFVATAHTDLAELALLNDQPMAARFELSRALPYARLTMRRLRCFLVALVGLLLTPLPITPTTHRQAVAMLFGAIVGLGKRTGDTLSPFHQHLIAERSASAQQLLSSHEWQATWQRGHAWTPAQAADAAERWLTLNFTE